MALFEQPLRFGTSGSVFENSVDPGSMLFGGAGRSNSLGQERDGTKGGLFGDKANVLDWFGSPITAGTNSQGLARGAAILWGLWALAGLGGGSAAASEGGSEGGTALGGGAGEAGGGSGWGDYLRWGQRGYNAYNMLQGGGEPSNGSGVMYPMSRTWPTTATTATNTNPLTGLSQEDLTRIVSGG